MRGAAIIVSCLLLASGAALVSCEGHGKYTSAFKDEALERQNAIRSATEWDAANQAFSSGELDIALEHIDQSIEFKDDVTKAHLLRARIMIERGDGDEALASIERGLELEETSELHYFRGIQLERMGDVRGAQASYARAFELDPSSLTTLMACAETLVDLGELERARALLLVNERAFGYSAGMHQLLGHLELLRDDLESAFVHFREASTLDPSSASIDEDLARVSVAMGRFAEADYTLGRLLERPSHADRRDLKLMRARTLLELDRPVEARDILRVLTRDTRGNTDVASWSMMIDVALKLDDMYLLEDASSLLIRIAPDRREGYLARAMLLHRTGRPEAALEMLDELAVRVGGEDRAADRLAEVIRSGLDGG